MASSPPLLNMDSIAEHVAPSSAEFAKRLHEQRQRLLDVFNTFAWRLPMAGTAVAVGTLMLFVVSLGERAPLDNPAVWLVILFIGSFLGATAYTLVLFFGRLTLSALIRRQDRLLSLVGMTTLQETLDEDFFTKLVKINFKYIDRYYQQTQAQADKSFILSAVVAALSFGLVLASISMMLSGYAEPAYVTAAAGVLGEFVATVLFGLYSKTIRKMAEYHQKLVITQNVSLALRIAEGLREPDRSRAYRDLIGRLTENVNEYLVRGAGQE